MLRILILLAVSLMSPLVGAQEAQLSCFIHGEALAIDAEVEKALLAFIAIRAAGAE